MYTSLSNVRKGPGPKNKRGTVKKEVKIPNSIQVLVQRATPKLKLMFSEPGRYILSGRGVQFVVVRIKEEIKYTPSIGQKMFQRKAMESKSSSALTSIHLGLYSESEADLEAEYQANQALALYDNLESNSISYEREFLLAKGIEVDIEELESDSATLGGKNNQAGNKLGRKRRAPNMLAPGWHVLKKGTGNKIVREYVGPRMSARRLLDIASGGTSGQENGNKKTPSKAGLDPSIEKLKLDSENVLSMGNPKHARAVGGILKKEFGARDMEGKVRKVGGALQITTSKDNRTKLSGALKRLEKATGNKFKIERKLDGDSVIVSIKAKHGKPAPNLYDNARKKKGHR